MNTLELFILNLLIEQAHHQAREIAGGIASSIVILVKTLEMQEPDLGAYQTAMQVKCIVGSVLDAMLFHSQDTYVNVKELAFRVDNIIRYRVSVGNTDILEVSRYWQTGCGPEEVKIEWLKSSSPIPISR